MRNARARARLDALLRPAWVAPILLVAGAALSAWYAGRSLPAPDEGAQLVQAAKILDGAVFYRELDAYPLPGAAYLLALAMKLFGEHLSVARALAGGLFCVSLLALYAAALGVLGRTRAALFAPWLLFLKLVGWPAFTWYLYPDVAFAFAMVAVALLLGERSRASLAGRAAAGLFVGLALVTKQNLGLYLGGAGLLVLWRPRRLFGGSVVPDGWLGRVGPFALASLLPVAAMAAYFASEGLLGRMVASGFLRPFTGYLPTSGIPYAPMLRWWELGRIEFPRVLVYLPYDYWNLVVGGHLFQGISRETYWVLGELFSRSLYTLIPVAFLWAGVRAVRRARGAGLDADDGTLSLALLAAAVVASALPRSDFVHVISVAPVAWLLFFALRRPSGRGVALEAVSVALALLLAAGLALHHRATLTHPLRLERASVDVSPQDAWVETLVDALVREVPPGEPLFVYGAEAHLYFLADRSFSWPFVQLYPGMEGGDGGRALAERLAEERPAVVVQGQLDFEGLPALPGYAPALERFIRARYRPDRRFWEEHPPLQVPQEWQVRVLRLRPPRLP